MSASTGSRTCDSLDLVTEFSISVHIDASPERVWDVMLDIERWAEWTRSVTSIKQLEPGVLRVGSRARIRQPRLPPTVWRVTEIDERGFTWVAGAGPARTVASHWVEADGDGSRATLSLRFDGFLGPFVARLTKNINDRYLAMEAEGLKARSEGRR